MGRKLYRVPLDFDWPLDMVWKGYHNPYHGQKCEPCKGTGYSPEYEKIKQWWYGQDEKDNFQWPREAAGMHNLTQEDVQVLIDQERLWDFTRVPRTPEQAELVRQRVANGKHNSWLPENNGYIPTAAEVNAWSLKGFGHDGSNMYYVCRARAEKLGLTLECKWCEGAGVHWPHPRYAKLYEQFKWREPPTGPGYQLWETTSEGSPQSPVFETIEELCQWAEKNATTFASSRTTAENWRRMLDADFVTHQEGNMVFI